MAPLPNEGAFSITFGAVPVPFGSSEHDGYLARPDGRGAFGSVILLPGVRGIGPVEKALARSLARHGRAVLVIDPYRGRGPASGADDAAVARAHDAVPDQRVVMDVGEAREYLASDDTTWADAGPSLLVGVDTGGRFALLAAAARSDIAGVVAIGAPLGGDGGRRLGVLDALGRIAAPILGLYGAADPLVPLEDVDAAQAAAPAARFIAYDGVGHAFLDPRSDDYHPGAEADALARVVALLDATVPAPV
jgi:carboxymethylenebutenolidase